MGEGMIRSAGGGSTLLWEVLLVYLAAVSAAALILYGVDKYRAVHHRWRIPEKTLLLVCFAGGGPGALLGMLLFHHKTRKWKFRLLVPAAIVLWAALLVFLRRG